MKSQIDLLHGRLEELAPLTPLLGLPPKVLEAVRLVRYLPEESQDAFVQVVRNLRRKPGRPWP